MGFVAYNICMDKKPSAQAEELARKLQEKLRHERPQWLRWVPLLAVVLLGGMAIIAWLLYPAPDAPRLTVTALDVLDVAGEPATVRAYLDPVEAEAKAGSLAGLEATFAIASAEADDGNQRRSAVSDEHGQATATFDAGLKGKTAYQIRQKSPSKKQDAQQDRAHITILDKNTPLLLVDVEETLADLDVKAWPKTNALNIALRAGAAEALQAAQAKQKFAVIYLVVASAPAKEYRKVRGWIEWKIKPTEPKPLPDGPVLGRLRYDAGGDREARHALLGDLRQRFSGPMVAVVRTAEAAEQCQKLDIRAIAMGGGDFPDQVTRIKGWDELPGVLAR